METHKKVSSLGALIAALVFSGCFQDSIVSQSESRGSKANLDPNIALLVASGLPEADIKLTVEPNADTAYIYEKSLTLAEKKKGTETVRLAFRKKTLDAARARAVATLDEKLAQGAKYATPVKMKIPESQREAANAMASARAASLGKSSQARWDHHVSLWDIKSLTEVHNIKVYITQAGLGKLGPGWIAGAREAMTKWNAVTGTQASFVETANINDCDVILKGALAPSGGVTTWLTPDPVVEKDSVEIVYNIGFETVFPHNQKVAMAMVAFGNILNMVHTNNEGYYWNGGTHTNIAGTPNNESASLFQTTIGPSVNPVFSANDLRAIRQMWPLNATASIDDAGRLWLPQWETTAQAAWNVQEFQQVGDTLFYLSGGQLFMRVGTTGGNVLIHSNNQVLSFQAGPSYIVVQRNDGTIYSRPLAGTAGGASWSYEFTMSAGEAYRLSFHQVAWLDYRPGFPVLRVFNLGTNTHLWEYSDSPGTIVDDFQLQGGRLFIAYNGNVYEKDVGVSNFAMVHWNNGGRYASRIRTSESHVAIHIWENGDGVVYTKPLTGGWWAWSWGEVYDTQHFDLCGDKVAMIGQGYYLMLRDLSNGNLYYPWWSINGSAHTVRLTGPMCDYVAKMDYWSGHATGKYSITDATDYIEYGWGQKGEQRP